MLVSVQQCNENERHAAGRRRDLDGEAPGTRGRDRPEQKQRQAMPSGQLTTKIPMAVATCGPLNQSVTIFVSSTLRSAAPVPLITRPSSAAP